MKILAITQARVGSTRLPGKVLKTIKNKTLLEIHLTRILQSKKISKLIVATTIEPGAEKIVAIAKKLGVESYRGSVNDVLERFYLAALPENPDYIVRLTSDCPLIDAVEIDKVINKCIQGKYDYTSNNIEPTFPDGLDTEVFKFSALKKAYNKATLKSDREHVTPYIWRNSLVRGGKIFNSFNVKYHNDFSIYRLTVDTQEDFDLIRNLISRLGIDKGWLDYVNYLDKNPKLMNINSKYERNEGYKKSLEEDKMFVKKMNTGQNLYRKAKTLIPGGTQLLSKRPEMFLPNHWPAYYSKAKGCYVWDMDGKKFIDMSYMGIGACVLGYANSEIDEAAIKAVRLGSMCTLNAPEEVELAELMCKLHPWAQMVRYTRGGGEAMSVAIRIARAKSGKDKILFCGYHGWHDWYLAANLAKSKNLDGHLLPGLDPLGVPRGLRGSSVPFNYNNTEEFLKLIKKYEGQVGVVVLESIRNLKPEKKFINTIAKVTKEQGIVFVVDEITAAWRINNGGAHLVLGIEPDIAVFGKAISNGFPMGVVIGKRSVMQKAQDTFISSTYWTDRIGPTTAIATIKYFKQNNVHKHLISAGESIRRGWKELAEKHNLKIEVGGLIPLSHFTFEYKNPLVLKTLFTQEMLELGFLATTAYYASYAHKPQHIKKYLEACDKVFGLISDAIKNGNPDRLLNGPVCHSGFKRLN
jgi:glutamate-1-semialdehyde aminotransferase/spore coat polysaccharide biosynthesis protein SpsF (cytidylyltransferase family)